MTKFSLVRSPALTLEEWQSVREARNTLESARLAAEKLSENIELAGEGE